MSHCTFAELFDRMLEARIPLGGDLTTVVNLVAAYQGTKPDVRASLFAEWLATEHFECERCRSEFTVRDNSVAESDPAVCVWCRNGYGLREPVTGWRRTFARS